MKLTQVQEVRNDRNETVLAHDGCGNYSIPRRKGPWKLAELKDLAAAITVFEKAAEAATPPAKK